MSSRISYDMVEHEAIIQGRKGHEIRLKLRYTGMLEVRHNGKLVLTDGPRDYSVALAKVKSIGMTAEPSGPPDDSVTDKTVQGGVSKKARAKKRATAKRGAA